MPRRLDGHITHTVAEVAHRLSLHEQTVYRLARTGALPMYKIGGQWFMDDEDLAALIHHPRGDEEETSG